MKKLMNKNFIQKIVIAILIVLSFNFVVPTFSHAADFGGVLFGPIIDLLAAIPDACIGLMQVLFLNGEYSTGTETKLINMAQGQGIGQMLFGSYLVGSHDYAGDVDKKEKFKTDFEDFAVDENDENDDMEKVIIDFAELDRGWFNAGGYSIPIVKYSPEKIFAGKIPALDVNFLNPKKWDTDAENEKSITQALHSTIAGWYNALRNLAIVALLSVLLYMAIRMIISSTASDKAKYKKMILDWLIALCLLFFLHYIMSFALTLTETLTEGLSKANSVIVEVRRPDNDLAEGGSNIDIKFKTDLMGVCRMYMQYADYGVRFPYVIMYIALVVYTIKFTWEYLKRAITMAFLTLMAPVVAITYPIDKLGDGKAQAFNMWLKEYIFNLLLQPFHLIIYVVFMESAMNIAVNNPIYAIFFLAFITPAEKLLRKFFGFDKSSSAGGSSFAGGFGGAAAFNMLKGAISKGAQGIQHARGGSGQNQQIRQKNNNMIKDPNAPNGNLDSFKNGNVSNDDEDKKRLSAKDQEALENKHGAMSEDKTNRDEALEKYSSEGFEKNADGEYFNPYTDEYDSNYDPHKDSSYNVPQKDEALEKYSSEGFGKNADGEYFNPYTDEYDSNYDPQKDSLYNTPQNKTASQSNEKTKNTQSAHSLNSAKNASAKQRFASKQSSRKLAESSKKGKKPIPPALKGVGRVAIRGVMGTAKVAGKLAGAAAIGTIGLGMGIAGDNLEDVLTYAATGATLGYSALPAMGRNAVNGVRNIGNTIRSEYELGAYGSTGASIQQYRRDTIHNTELRADEKERMTRENGVAPTKTELNERMEQVADYQLAGVSDSSVMHKAMNLEKEINEQLEQNNTMDEKERNKTSRNQAIEIAKIAEEYSAKDLRDDKKVDQLRSSLVGKLTKGSSGLSGDKANTTADGIIENVKRLKGV